MRLLFNLIRAWRIATTELKYSPIYELPGVWTQEDQDVLANFMKTPTGDKLGKRLDNLVVKAQGAACDSNSVEAVRSLGIARGVALTINNLKTHFVSRPRPAA